MRCFYRRVLINLQKLTKGKDSWSLAEVVHAIVILTHFHSLCSFVFSCGVNQELDQAGGYKYPEMAAMSTTNTNISKKSDPKDIPILNDTRPPGKLHVYELHAFHLDRIYPCTGDLRFPLESKT